MRITYPILTLLICIFHILYKGDLSFILMIFLLVLPVMLFAVLAVQSAFLTIRAEGSSQAAARGRQETIRITFENRSFLPIASCMLKFRYVVYSPPDKQHNGKYLLNVPISLRAKETVTVGFTPLHCGYADISLKNAIVNDMIGLTFITKKIGLNDRITILPDTYEFFPDTERDLSSDMESSTFSETSAGDDPSEIFELRTYRPGDSVNRIHWKLSSRGEEFIVKELSKPTASRILILCDTGSCRTASETDAVLDIAATISAFLVKIQASHTLTAPSADGTLLSLPINDNESMTTAFSDICCGQASFGKRITDEILTQEISEMIRKGCSRVLAVSTDDSKAFADELSQLCGETALTIFCAASPSDRKDAAPSSAEIIYSSAEELDDNFRRLHNVGKPYSE